MRKRMLLGGSIASLFLTGWLISYLDETTRASCAGFLSYGGLRVWSYSVTRDLAAGGTTAALILVWHQIVKRWGPQGM